MKKNMGILDRLIRTAIAVIITILFYNGIISGTLGVIALVVAGIFFLTSIAGYCPLYSLLGIRICTK